MELLKCRQQLRHWRGCVAVILLITAAMQADGYVPVNEMTADAGAPYVIYDQPGGFNVLRHVKHGVIVHNKNDAFVGRSLQEYGQWGEDEVQLFQQILGSLGPASVVVDVGANFGAFTLVFAKACPKGTVLAFEPQMLVFQALCATVALNNLENVNTYQLAVGAEVGHSKLERFRPRLPGINVSAASLTSPAHTVEDPARLISGHDIISVVTLDSLNLERLDLLKIDSEGMEPDVLLGGRGTILRLQPFIYLETNLNHDLPCNLENKMNCRLEDDAVDALKLMAAWEYTCYWVRSKPYLYENFYKNEFNVFEGPTEVVLILNSLCIPNTRKVKILHMTEVDMGILPRLEPFWLTQKMQEQQEAADKAAEAGRAAGGHADPEQPEDDDMDEEEEEEEDDDE